MPDGATIVAALEVAVSRVSSPRPAGLGTVSVHDVAGAYTAQRAFRRFPYTTRHGGGGRTLYTCGHVRAGLCTLAFSGRAALYAGGPVPRGLCTLGPTATVQTPSGIHPPVRKVPLPPPDVALLRWPRTSRTPSEDPRKVQKPPILWLFGALRGRVLCEAAGGQRREAGLALFQFCRHR